MLRSDFSDRIIGPSKPNTDDFRRDRVALCQLPNVLVMWQFRQPKRATSPPKLSSRRCPLDSSRLAYLSPPSCARYIFFIAINMVIAVLNAVHFLGRRIVVSRIWLRSSSVKWDINPLNLEFVGRPTRILSDHVMPLLSYNNTYE